MRVCAQVCTEAQGQLISYGPKMPKSCSRSPVWAFPFNLLCIQPPITLRTRQRNNTPREGGNSTGGKLHTDTVYVFIIPNMRKSH